MIPKVIYTAGLSETPDMQRLTAWRYARQTMHPEWDVVTLTLDTKPPILNYDQWQQTFELAEPAASAARLNLMRYEVLTRFRGVYLDTDVKPIRPLDEMCPPEVRAWAACEQLDIVTIAAMGFPPNHPATWHAVAMVEESFSERRYVGDQAGPGLIARVVTQYDGVALCPPVYFNPTVVVVGVIILRKHGILFGLDLAELTEPFGMVQVERRVDRLLLAAHLHRLAAQDRGKRGEPLLPIEQQLVACERAGLLGHRQVAAGLLFVRLLDEDRPAGIAPVEGIDQVTDARRAPDVAPLHLRQPQLAAFDHADQVTDVCIDLAHGSLAFITRGTGG